MKPITRLSYRKSTNVQPVSKAYIFLVTIKEYNLITQYLETQKTLAVNG